MRELAKGVAPATLKLLSWNVARAAAGRRLPRDAR